MPAILSSNCGTRQIGFEIRAPARYADEPGFESSIHVRGEHWGGDQTHPCSVSIDGFWLCEADLIAFRDHMSRWVRQPIDRLAAEDLNGEFQLAKKPGQSLLLCFGPRVDTLSDLNPVISVCFAAGFLHGGCHFITDQSCLALFIEELSTCIATQ